MKWLSDDVLARLQNDVRLPDLSGTRYRAVRFLGRGGMGSVWLAEDTLLHRQVALKVLAPESSSPELGARLLREAEVLARLEHPGIVPVHDAGTLADGRTFYCMKYVEGQTLDQFASQAGLRQKLELVRRVAEPLAFAHARGFVHRDLKPGNIMIGAFGEVLVMDWGLAKLVGSAPDSFGPSALQRAGNTVPQTSHGAVLGTPGFMAPEQEKGEVHLIDQRTDIYGLGAVLDFLLRSQERKAGWKMPPKPLLAICRKAMAPDIAARYASVEEMSADVGRYQEGLPVGAYRENLVERAYRFYLRHQAAIVLVLAYLLMRLLFILFSRRA